MTAREAVRQVPRDMMLKGHHFNYLWPEKWDGLWLNRQQLMSVFARKNKVLFIDPETIFFRSVAQSILQRRIGHSDFRQPTRHFDLPRL